MLLFLFYLSTQDEIPKMINLKFFDTDSQNVTKYSFPYFIQIVHIYVLFCVPCYCIFYCIK